MKMNKVALFGGTFDPLVARSGSRGQDDVYSDITRSEFIERRLRFKTRKYYSLHFSFSNFL